MGDQHADAVLRARQAIEAVLGMGTLAVKSGASGIEKHVEGADAPALEMRDIGSGYGYGAVRWS
jgi:hypothetical protein